MLPRTIPSALFLDDGTGAFDSFEEAQRLSNLTSQPRDMPLEDYLDEDVEWLVVQRLTRASICKITKSDGTVSTVTGTVGCERDDKTRYLWKAAQTPMP